MAQLIEIADIATGYTTIIKRVHDRGISRPSRNGPVTDLEDVMIVVSNPRKTLPVKMGAGVNVDLYRLEAAQLITGISEPQLMWDIAPNTRQFAEANGQFWGAYGPRTRGQFYVAASRLKENPDDRQVIVTFWDKNMDLFGPRTRDHPCTLHMRFGITNGVLTTSTVMRSNDINWGFKYDLPVFCTVHLTMASVLGVEPGPYTHHAHSFHMYDRDADRMSNIRATSPANLPNIEPMISEEGCFTHGWDRAMVGGLKVIRRLQEKVREKLGDTAVTDA